MADRESEDIAPAAPTYAERRVAQRACLAWALERCSDDVSETATFLYLKYHTYDPDRFFLLDWAWPRFGRKKMDRAAFAKACVRFRKNPKNRSCRWREYVCRALLRVRGATLPRDFDDPILTETSFPRELEGYLRRWKNRRGAENLPHLLSADERLRRAFECRPVRRFEGRGLYPLPELADRVLSPERAGRYRALCGGLHFTPGGVPWTKSVVRAAVDGLVLERFPPPENMWMVRWEDERRWKELLGAERWALFQTAQEGIADALPAREVANRVPRRRFTRYSVDDMLETNYALTLDYFSSLRSIKSEPDGGRSVRDRQELRRGVPGGRGADETRERTDVYGLGDPGHDPVPVHGR